MNEPTVTESAEASPDTIAPPVHKTTVRRPRFFHWPTLLLAFVVLICGIVIGAAGTTAIIGKRIVDAVQHPESNASRAANRLRRQLDLTDDQTQQVEKILAERTKAFGAIYRDNLPRIAQEFALTKQQIAEVLTPEQQQEWQERMARLERIAQLRTPQSP
ncbi:MAG: hypothetical protein K1Y02_04425 [Candidatus Hydrogenedentes bacterium]|nr:hypothetical protein [Candidatus Hydrogenedentota bacterium]